MSIGNAIQKGQFVVIYDDKGHEIASVYLGSSGDSLKGYTSSTVNVKKGPFIITYNEKGQEISSNYVG